MSGRSRWSGWVRDYRLLIFDWDGTLVDSIGRIVASLRYAAGMCDLPQLDDEQLKGIIGLGMLEAIDCLYPGLRATSRQHCSRVCLKRWMRFGRRVISWRLLPEKVGEA